MLIMKTNKLLLIAILMMVSSFLFVGCKKDNAKSVDMDKCISATDMLKFDSFDDIFDYIISDGGTIHNVRDFVSYAEYMEKEYLELDPENYFHSKEEMIQYAIENSDKYQLILGEDGEYTFETKMFDHDYKYVANKDGIFQVKDKIYKIIEGGLVYTSEIHIQELIDYIDNGNRESNAVFSFILFDDNEISEKSYCAVCATSHNWTKYNGDNKLYFEIKLYLTNNNTKITYKHYAKPYHHNFLGWFGCIRTITCSYNNQVVFKNAAGHWPEILGNQWIPQYPYRWDFQDSWTSPSSSYYFETVCYLNHPILSWMWEFEHPNTGGFMFNILDATASTPDVGEIRVYCPKHYVID